MPHSRCRPPKHPREAERNLAPSHKGRRCAGPRAAGAKLFFLPKYSPDLNAFEQLFSKLKHWLRMAARRTIETVCDAIGQTLDRVTPMECSNYFENSGYDRK
ncbi:hypothetical protein FJ958_24105 [Mesorhizobium sp. B2-3-5]|nr:hypothetical protein FJ958_24105 [Mesorhizobium sp. B2-3-5]